ncbi:MAG TPA: ABC transporter permease [Gemmatimonadaceae bacterium]|nr:ABC transporter permease [Gemmatimonadaceae bacterium]
MNPLEAVRLALSTIRTQKLKSAFTLLGVCLGVMFLIAVVSIVNGMGTYLKDDLVGKLIAINSFELRHRPNINIGDVDQATWEEYRRRKRLRYHEVGPVAEALPPGTRYAVIADNSLNLTSRYSNTPRSVRVNGVEGDFFEIKALGVTEGRLPTPQEYALGTPVVVIGPDVVDRLFPALDPIGRELRINGIPYNVIGIAESQGSAFGMSFDNVAYVPYKAPARRLYNSEPSMIDAVLIQSPSEPEMLEAMEAVRQVMRVQHQLRPSQKDDFALQTADSALAFWEKLEGYLVIAGVVLPAFGLVVGAIVIMNIMLVAVAERTAEIGLRKALGAKRRDVLAQFLVESSTLGAVGAAIGVGLGVLLAFVMRAVTPLPTAVAPWSIVLGVLVGAGVGIISGVYPASRASRLDPIIALRQE